MSEFEEYKMQVQSMYDEYLMKTEKRNISYGELYYIQNLSEKELTKLVNELQYELYEKEEK